MVPTMAPVDVADELAGAVDPEGRAGVRGDEVRRAAAGPAAGRRTGRCSSNRLPGDRWSAGWPGRCRCSPSGTRRRPGRRRPSPGGSATAATGAAAEVAARRRPARGVAFAQIRSDSPGTATKVPLDCSPARMLARPGAGRSRTRGSRCRHRRGSRMVSASLSWMYTRAGLAAVWTGSAGCRPPARLSAQEATIGASIAVTRTAVAAWAEAEATKGSKRGSATATTAGTATALPAVVPAANPMPLLEPRLRMSRYPR